jgi:hypothetical protein
MLIHNPIFTGSIQLNGTDISQISTVSNDSSSFASRITSTESTASAFILASGSFSDRTTLAEATASALVTASGSLAARIASNEARTGSYATTGSNQFNGSQTVTGSLTATGTIVAQTLVVQTITASVEFVTGSNRFGTTTGNTHEFTGSLLVSGSHIVNGNVGIGTTNPYTRLDVASSVSINGRPVIDNSSAELYIGGITGVSGRGTDVVALYTANTERMRITSGGNVGIGTTSPNAYTNLIALTINGTLGSVLDFATGGTTYGEIYSLANEMRVDAIGASSTLKLLTNSSTRMSITSVGNFDYGGFNVQSSNNSVYRQAFWGPMSVMWRNAEDAYINSNHTYGSSNTNVASYASSNGIGRLSIYGGNLEWGSYNGSVSAGTAYTLSSRFIVTKAGSVGIGTDNPIDTLNVVGNVRVGTGNSFKASYDGGNNNYHGALSWATLQLGNNGDNRIIGGRTAAGGNLKFYVNNTNDATNYATAPDGTLALTLASTGAATFSSSVNSGGSIASGVGLSVSNATNARKFELGYSTGAGYNFFQVYDGSAFQPMMINNSLYVTGTNVGIGTTAPVSALHVYANLSANPITFEGNGSSNAWVRWKAGASTSTWQLGASSGAFIFYDEYVGSERMRITSDGYLAATNTGTYRNIAAAQHSLRNNANSNNVIDVNHSGTSPYGILVSYSSVDPNNTTNYILSGYSYSSSTSLYNIWSNGTTSGRSDARLKKNIVDSTPKLDKLMQLRVVNYEWKESLGGTKELGLIAQEVEEVFPNLVITQPIVKEREITLENGTKEIEKYEDGDYKSLKNSVLPYITIKALQELTAKVQELSAKVAALEAQQ